MSDLAIAALLGGTILVASMISVELGLSVALIELVAGVIVGNAAHIVVPSWLVFIGSFAGIVLTFQAGAEVDLPQLRREWKASVSIGLVSFFAPFAVVGLVAYYGSAGRGVPRRSEGSRCRRRASPSSTPSSSRPASIASSSGSGSCRRRSSPTSRPSPASPSSSSSRPSGSCRSARLARPHLRAAARRAPLLPPLRQPRDRAGDQARLRVPLPADVAGAESQLAGGATGVRPRARDVGFLRLAPPRAGPAARRVVRVSDAVLLHQGWPQRVDERALGEPRDPRDPLRGEDGAEVRRRLSAGTAVHRAARCVHDAPDVDRADVRDDHVPVRPVSGDHRPVAVLAAAGRRRPLGSRADGDRATLLPTGLAGSIAISRRRSRRRRRIRASCAPASARRAGRRRRRAPGRSRRSRA